ncbi:LAMI_0F02278g1_1 [Lachancea mirantina]|uniref:LAMI_0F02278g1_1 n=1 Tax=Lachancea mirantina TaxID=1230905 RepID=A0A1G4JWJ3_9SACH|nr:LAMI_0F02278g1_1 [Lachancea mirantina]
MANQIPLGIKLKTLLKMCIQRLRYTQEKQHALARVSRREVAKLLSEGKENKAHYRVEALINDDVHIELLEILELYCELLHTRIGLLNTVVNAEDLSKNHNEDGINEAVRALLYCVVEVSEIRELQQLKDLFALKFGLDFIKKISDEKEGVPEKILKKNALHAFPAKIWLFYILRKLHAPMMLITATLTTNPKIISKPQALRLTTNQKRVNQFWQLKVKKLSRRNIPLLSKNLAKIVRIRARA